MVPLDCYGSISIVFASHIVQPPLFKMLRMLSCLVIKITWFFYLHSTLLWSLNFGTISVLCACYSRLHRYLFKKKISSNTCFCRLMLSSYSSTWTELVTPGESKLDYYQDQLHLKYQPVTVASQNISQWVPFYLYVPFCTLFYVCTILSAIISHELTAIHVQVFMGLLFANWHLSHALPSYPTVPLICPMSYVQCIPDLLSMRNNSRSIFSFGTTTLYFMMRTLYNVTNSRRCHYLLI